MKQTAHISYKRANVCQKKQTDMSVQLKLALNSCPV